MNKKKGSMNITPHIIIISIFIIIFLINRDIIFNSIYDLSLKITTIITNSITNNIADILAILTLTIILMVYVIIKINKSLKESDKKLKSIITDFEKFKLEAELKLYMLNDNYSLINYNTNKELTDNELIEILTNHSLGLFFTNDKVLKDDENLLKTWDFTSNKVCWFTGDVDEDDFEFTLDNEEEFNLKYCRKILLYKKQYS